MFAFEDTARVTTRQRRSVLKTDEVGHSSARSEPASLLLKYLRIGLRRFGGYPEYQSNIMRAHLVASSALQATPPINQLVRLAAAWTWSMTRHARLSGSIQP